MVMYLKIELASRVCFVCLLLANWYSLRTTFGQPVGMFFCVIFVTNLMVKMVLGKDTL